MTRENIISGKLYQKSLTSGHVRKLFLESDFSTNEKRKQEGQEALNRSPEYTGQKSNI